MNINHLLSFNRAEASGTSDSARAFYQALLNRGIGLVQGGLPPFSPYSPFSRGKPIQSMSRGHGCCLFVLSMNVGGMSDAIDDGRIGHLVGLGNLEALTAVFRIMNQEQSMRERMSLASCKLSVCWFFSVHQARSYFELAKEVLYLEV